ncbi:group II intron reverse transcriptase/maturase [Paenibacillus sp. p3-SID867]|uniref:group II intron reverse transcriptase/maturase n=1 Tax=Paenibacillus sp. p3-SID867 TaxID=2916363 RepID=UPI0021A3A496|nr:group II intron reverse transcriptase/maturase [Paenibacillus sp. p3-SID867]MCT1402883.1 group II intron reverse transcriptase/maturase [Paenibacillus sp. p3-SID867]
MTQKFDYPKTELELRDILDKLFAETRDKIISNDLPRFKGLLEIISSEPNILSAIHKIKANKGSQTAGSDGKKMRDSILERDYQEIILLVRENLTNYSPRPVRRVWIPKPGKEDKRPLGIPTILDRIIQECVRAVIEPILEAQFFRHSYGFRPMRDSHMALGKITNTVHTTGYHWIIEGDISKFFDNVNHTILLKKLWHMGIRDRRVLMIIKYMLKAGIMDELQVNDLGTPQGGIISPLLANVYLDKLDQWIVREWEEKKTRHHYKRHDKRIEMLRKNSNLKPAYLIRYADDWVLITSSKSNAEKWKKRISYYLEVNLKLKLSEEKTLITNIRKKPINFVGFNYKVVKGNSLTGWVPRIRPNPERLKSKVYEILNDIKNLGKGHPKQTEFHYQLVRNLTIINSKIRGVIQYYRVATWVHIDLSKYAQLLSRAGYMKLRRYGGSLTPANMVDNLVSVHSQYKSRIPSIRHQNMTVGLTNLRFATWQRAPFKKQEETPYSKEGRKIYYERTQKKPLQVRADELLSISLLNLIGTHLTNTRYNFEYFMNRPYAFNRDKGKCRICGRLVEPYNVHIHHTNPNLELSHVNRVNNLATLHEECHRMIHSSSNFEHLGGRIWRKILYFREILSEM